MGIGEETTGARPYCARERREMLRRSGSVPRVGLAKGAVASLSRRGTGSLQKSVKFRAFQKPTPIEEFAGAHLMAARYPFKKPFHVIFCRNGMIYFDGPTRRRLVRQLYD